MKVSPIASLTYAPYSIKFPDFQGSLLCNTGEIIKPLEYLVELATRSHGKRSFNSWMVQEGLEEGEISEVIENMYITIRRYTDLMWESNNDQPYE